MALLLDNLAVEEYKNVETHEKCGVEESEKIINETLRTKENINKKFFSKLKNYELDMFFNFHPKQPHDNVPFKPKKSFFYMDNIAHVAII